MKKLFKFTNLNKVILFSLIAIPSTVTCISAKDCWGIDKEEELQKATADKTKADAVFKQTTDDKYQADSVFNQTFIDKTKADAAFNQTFIDKTKADLAIADFKLTLKNINSDFNLLLKKSKTKLSTSSNKKIIFKDDYFKTIKQNPSLNSLEDFVNTLQLQLDNESNIKMFADLTFNKATDDKTTADLALKKATDDKTTADLAFNKAKAALA